MGRRNVPVVDNRQYSTRRFIQPPNREGSRIQEYPQFAPNLEWTERPVVPESRRRRSGDRRRLDCPAQRPEEAPHNRPTVRTIDPIPKGYRRSYAVVGGI